MTARRAPTGLPAIGRLARRAASTGPLPDPSILHVAVSHVLRVWLALSLVSLVTAAHAGEPKESRSRRDGVFAAWFSPAAAEVHVFFEGRRGAEALVRHCRAHRPVHLLPAGTPYACRTEPLSIEAGGGEGLGVRLWVRGPDAQPDRWGHGIFTLAAPRHVRWTERPATAGERAAVHALLTADRSVGRAVQARAVGTARAVSAAGRGRTIVVVPGKRVSDPFGDSQRHHVFLVAGDAARHLGAVPDRPKQYLDLDGDDLPEVVTDGECDGLCVAVWNVSPRVRSIVRFEGH